MDERLMAERFEKELLMKGEKRWTPLWDSEDFWFFRFLLVVWKKRLMLGHLPAAA